MPHERSRYLSQPLKKALKFSPIVGLLGQRQTGKTTLLLSQVGSSYVSMDDLAQLRIAQQSPATFVERPGLFGIDECQLAPELFPALKLRVQKHKGPGQFILTGSIRFTSRKLIRESLTGRIFNLQLLPLTLMESHDFPLGDLFESMKRPLEGMQKRLESFLKASPWSAQKVEAYLNSGGLPGICFHRERTIRIGKWNAHLETILERDLRMVIETSLPYSSLRRILEMVAERQGEPANISEWSRKSRVSTPTLKKILSAYEALFLIRKVSSIGDRKRDIFFVEDQGMATYLSARNDSIQDKIRALFAELNAQALYRYPAEAAVSSYETRGGSWVPLVFSKGNHKIGLIPVIGDVPDLRALHSARSFLKRFPKAQILIVNDGKEIIPIDSRMFSVPYSFIYA